MPLRRERARLDSGLKLDLNNLRRGGVVVPGESTIPKRISWEYTASGELMAWAIIYSNTQCPEEGGSLSITLGQLKQEIRLQAVPRHFGGHQWYFVCPLTGRLSSVLWMPSFADQFASREAWGRRVAYSSQFATAHDRAIFSARHIHYQLGAKGRISMDAPLPQKPKGMHWRTYDKLACRHNRYRNIAMNCFFDAAVRLSSQIAKYK